MREVGLVNIVHILRCLYIGLDYWTDLLSLKIIFYTPTCMVPVELQATLYCPVKHGLLLLNDLLTTDGFQIGGTYHFWRTTMKLRGSCSVYVPFAWIDASTCISQWAGNPQEPGYERG